MVGIKIFLTGLSECTPDIVIQCFALVHYDRIIRSIIMQYIHKLTLNNFLIFED